MILNLLRGTGYAGLSAMNEVRELMRGSGVYLYRPLLRVSRKDLAICADARNLKWVEDVSNRDLRYARNAVRAELAQMAPADLDEFCSIRYRALDQPIPYSRSDSICRGERYLLVDRGSQETVAHNPAMDSFGMDFESCS